MWVQMKDIYAAEYLLSSATVKKYKRKDKELPVCLNSNLRMVKYPGLYICVRVCLCMFMYAQIFVLSLI